MDTGFYIIAIIVILFYLRLFLIRRGHRRREKLEMLDRMKQGKHAKALPQREFGAPTIKVKSWWILIPGALLMLFGLGMHYEGFLPELSLYYWVPLAIGGILFIFGFE